MAGDYNKAQRFGWYRRQGDAVLNAMHAIVGKDTDGTFRLDSIKTYFRNRGSSVELQEWYLNDKNLRPIIRNMVYCEQWGASPFNVAFKGNEPHVDHIYPQDMLRSKMGCGTSEINDIGNLRFVRPTTSASAPNSPAHIGAAQKAGIPIDEHLLVSLYSHDPSEMKFERLAFDQFRQLRRAAIWRSAKNIVDPEIKSAVAQA